ncbi:MAG: hypothetical protein WCT08_04215 [Patescibacteria group bacterium]|jgi:hypothetical protein
MDNNIEKRISDIEIRLKKLEEKNKIVISQGDVKRAQLSLGEFLSTKLISNDVERTLAIAYYLEFYEKMQQFNISDLENGFRSARYKLPKNINDKVNMNIKKGHLAEEKGKKDFKKAWYITDAGVKYIETELNNK